MYQVSRSIRTNRDLSGSIVLPRDNPCQGGYTPGAMSSIGPLEVIILLGVAAFVLFKTRPSVFSWLKSGIKQTLAGSPILVSTNPTRSVAWWVAVGGGAFLALAIWPVVADMIMFRAVGPIEIFISLLLAALPFWPLRWAWRRLVAYRQRPVSPPQIF